MIIRVMRNINKISKCGTFVAVGLALSSLLVDGAVPGSSAGSSSAHAMDIERNANVKVDPQVVASAPVRPIPTSSGGSSAGSSGGSAGGSSAGASIVEARSTRSKSPRDKRQSSPAGISNWDAANGRFRRVVKDLYDNRQACKVLQHAGGIFSDARNAKLDLALSLRHADSVVGNTRQASRKRRKLEDQITPNPAFEQAFGTHLLQRELNYPASILKHIFGFVADSKPSPSKPLPLRWRDAFLAPSTDDLLIERNGKIKNALYIETPLSFVAKQGDRGFVTYIIERFNDENKAAIDAKRDLDELGVMYSRSDLFQFFYDCMIVDKDGNLRFDENTVPLLSQLGHSETVYDFQIAALRVFRRHRDHPIGRVQYERARRDPMLCLLLLTRVAEADIVISNFSREEAFVDRSQRRRGRRFPCPDYETMLKPALMKALREKTRYVSKRLLSVNRAYLAASFVGNIDIMKYLQANAKGVRLSLHDKVNAVNAVHLNDVNTLRYYLDTNRVHINAQLRGKTFLRFVAASTNKWVATTMGAFLLARGADPNLPDTGGFTALMSAAFHGNMVLAEMLCDCPRTDVDFHSLDGKIALDYAIKEENWDIAALLVQTIIKRGDAGVLTPERLSLLAANEKTAEAVTETVTATRADTLLMWAAFHDKLDVVRAIHAMGANVNQRNDIGLTALHQVVLLGTPASREMVKFLCMEAKADPRIKDQEGMTPIDYSKAVQLTTSSKRELSVQFQNSWTMHEAISSMSWAQRGLEFNE
jgi:hypothetical protein